ncbi:DUF4357 domain-containing protein [Faecalibacterium sp. Marseille-P9312]|uniref:DUF4357 domain-containing protein n=1 Tax=Faecalibacterium sp. Marseille-P9312 TaxID=2580425 RepID=UPI00122D3658|nr:DUF4357 domain-containing protein [Faecalibacterium sp. Marseille-P9312]
MKVFLERKRTNISAQGEFDPTTKTLTVFKGSTLSESIAYTEKFRGAATIEKHRAGIVENNVLLKDVVFKSASTAANFVTGSSTNGLTAWKTSDGKAIRDLVKAEKAEA